MQKIYFLVLAFSFFNGLDAQIINFPDTLFRYELLQADSSYHRIATDSNGAYIKIDANNNGEIEVNEAAKVYSLSLDFGLSSRKSAAITDFTGISNFTSLRTLYCISNKASNLDVSGLTLLENLVCTSSDQLESLNVSGLKKLSSLDCHLNSISSLNLTGCSNLISLNCDDNNLTTIDISNSSLLNKLSCWKNNLTTLNLNGLTNLTELSCAENSISVLNFGSSINIQKIDCSFNKMIALDVRALKDLQEFDCAMNLLTSLNVDGLSKLTWLECSFNQLNSLDASSLINLNHFKCIGNKLSSLNIKGLRSLGVMDCSRNKLTSLDLSGLEKIEILDCSTNQLSELNLNGVASFYGYFYLTCFDNLLTSLDLSTIRSIHSLDCSNNPLLESINLKNGGNNYNSRDSNLNFSNNLNLHYICQDEFDIYNTQSLINNYGYKNCTVNTYCSFVPGGPFYTIRGKSKFDLNNNGCDDQDTQFPNLKFDMSDGINRDNFIFNTSGNCNIPVQAGTHKIIPILENPTYFTISPTEASVTFPTQSSPFIQDFCVTANGLHPDLEVSLLPISRARPGFDTTYKIIYKNKGNQVQSGVINLTLDDTVLDFVSSIPEILNQSNKNISWNFTDLKPFESREIKFTLNLNTPTATPPLNNGDILLFTAKINSTTIDETPKDNEFSLNQAVVNSFDPNDKTCLEGTVVTSSLIGQYVHYMIRFENKGTYSAKNIVVKDMIDLSKFDISTLVPTDASHSYIAKISDVNKVEFIFEDINLPFDDANNDGYIAFKIKTLPTLVAGDSFTNEANIYFDYNFPVLTNKATSKFATALGTQDFEFSNYFKVYPNPANEVLNISVKNNIQIQSIAVYDILGQLVIALPNIKDTSKIDVSNLSSGNYFLKIKSDKGSSSIKFVKN